MIPTDEKQIIDCFGLAKWNETKQMVDECESEWLIVHDIFKNIVYYRNIGNSSLVRPTPYTGQHITIASRQLSAVHHCYIRRDGTNHNLIERSYYVANRWKKT
jgi:hypothetical protein